LALRSAPARLILLRNAKRTNVSINTSLPSRQAGETRSLDISPGKTAHLRRPRISEGETPMTKSQSLVTQISTTVAGIALATYAVAFLINAASWI
jgi:hypothetical protein